MIRLSPTGAVLLAQAGTYVVVVPAGRLTAEELAHYLELQPRPRWNWLLEQAYRDALGAAPPDPRVVDGRFMGR
jgi:hypothetical protein